MLSPTTQEQFLRLVFLCRGKEVCVTAKSRISLLSNSSDGKTYHCYTHWGWGARRGQRMLENPQEPYIGSISTAACSTFHPISVLRALDPQRGHQGMFCRQ